MELFLAAAGLIVSAAVLILFLLRSGRERQAQDAQLRQIEALTAQQQAFGRESAAQIAALASSWSSLRVRRRMNSAATGATLCNTSRHCGKKPERACGRWRGSLAR